MKTKIPLSRYGRKKRKLTELILLTTIFILVVLNVKYAMLDIKVQRKKVNVFDYTIARFSSYNEKTLDGSDISKYAIKFKGNPYVHGGTSLTKGADCSGFTQSIYKHFGIAIPRTVDGQSKVGKKVSFNELKEGDLVFYSNGGDKPTHVALYIGEDKIIHASTPQSGIKINTVHIMTKVTARRVKE